MKFKKISCIFATLLVSGKAKMECQMSSIKGQKTFQCQEKAFKTVSQSNTLLASRPNTFIGERLIAEGQWGVWGPWYWAPDDQSLGCGIDVKSEEGYWDKTGTNAIDIHYCSVSNWTKQQTGGYSGGTWGKWNVKLCPQNMYIAALEMQVQGHGFGDDTAANQVRFMCIDLFRQTQTEWIYAGFTNQGTWKTSQFTDTENQWLCGTKARVEASCGTCDDTALNGLVAGACKTPPGFTISIKPQSEVQCKVLGQPQSILKTSEEQWTNDLEDDYDGKSFEVCNDYNKFQAMSKSNTVVRPQTQTWSTRTNVDWNVQFSVSLAKTGDNSTGQNVDNSTAVASSLIQSSIEQSFMAEQSGQFTGANQKATAKTFQKSASTEDCKMIRVNPEPGYCQKAQLNTMITKMRASCEQKVRFEVKQPDGNYLIGDQLSKAFRSAGYQDDFTMDQNANKFLEFTIQSSHSLVFKSQSQGSKADC